jgi:hypothetical protein
MQGVMRTVRLRVLALVFSIAAANAVAGDSLAYDTIGNGNASKWGDDPFPGSGAVVTWGYMADGTDVDPAFRIDPFAHPDISGVVGTSNISQLRSTVDAAYGEGSFNGAIESALASWSAAANITFVGPVEDSGLPVASTDAYSPMIRIGAFAPDPNHWFSDTSAIGIGPPGFGGFENFPESGDILFNLHGLGMITPYQIAHGEEDVDPVDVFQYGDDVEGLILHELGHAAIGLNHPRWAGEDPDRRVMYVGDPFGHPEWPICCTAINRQLHADDIAAAQYVYGIRGDYNRDGVVDAADYTVWRDSFGAAITSGTGADGNVDGMVEALDYEVWKSHFGDVRLEGFGEQDAQESSLAAGVPEGSSLALLGVGAAILAARARGRASRPAVAAIRR